MGTACFDAFSDGYIVDEFNEIPWQKIAENSHYGPRNPGKRQAGLDDGPNRFCVVQVYACTWLLENFCCISCPLQSDMTQ